MNKHLDHCGYYTIHFIEFDLLKSTKVVKCNNKKWTFSKIESWFQLKENFEYVQTLQEIESKTESIVVSMTKEFQRLYIKNVQQISSTSWKA